MDEQARADTNVRPRFFNSVSGWIAGATGLITALTSLVIAWDKLPFTSQANSETVHATALSSDRPSYTTEDGGTLRWVDGMWVWTDADGEKWRYEESSNDSATIVAVSKGRGDKGQDIYLRWPRTGGQALQSFDGQETWSNPLAVTPDEPAN